MVYEYIIGTRAFNTSNNRKTLWCVVSRDKSTPSRAFRDSFPILAKVSLPSSWISGRFGVFGMIVFYFGGDECYSKVCLTRTVDD
ncbi:unnamed protein product [Brassica oleracea var. botrytis]